jgi:hypothetical protein
MMRSLSDTLLMLGGIWRCWMFRRLTSASRILAASRLITLAGILTALADITLADISRACTALAGIASTGIALTNILFLYKCQIISQQLLVLA